MSDLLSVRPGLGFLIRDIVNSLGNGFEYGHPCKGSYCIVLITVCLNVASLEDGIQPDCD